jgi:large subunit ribosomal protein L25
MTTEAVKLELEPRETLGKKVKQLRRAGIIPVHLYGPEVESQALQCEQREVLRALAHSGGATPIVVTVKGQAGERLTFAREVQWHPVRGDILHVDFMAVRATQQVAAQVPINLVGESSGARQAGGTVIQQLRELSIEALPLDIPSEIELDLESLTDPEGVLRAGQIALPTNITMLTDAEEVVVRIEAARAEGPVPAPEDAAEGQAPASPEGQAEATGEDSP